MVFLLINKVVLSEILQDEISEGIKDVIP